MLLLDTIFINNSGGLGLLNVLVNTLEARQVEVTYLFDARNSTDYSFIPNKRKFFRGKNLVERLKFYKTYGNQFNKVLCFGNIPPPLKLPKANVYTYVHQYFYVANNPGRKLDVSFPLKRLFLKTWLKNTDEVWVQTKHMKKLFEQRFGSTNVQEHPFFESISDSIPPSRDMNFVYISNGNPHKNHNVLLDAWSYFAVNHPNAILHLTVDINTYPKFEQQVNKSRNVINHGLISKTDVSQLLNSNYFVVYPSLAESLGLGLIEAAQHRNFVLAADLDYTYSVIKPSLTFNPISSLHLAQKLEELYLHHSTYSEAQLIIKDELDGILERLINK